MGFERLTLIIERADYTVTTPDNFINSDPLSEAQLAQVIELVDFSWAY